MHFFGYYNRFVCLIAALILVACDADDKKSKDKGNESITPLVEEAQFEKPASTELLTLDQSGAVNQLINAVQEDFSNHSMPDSDASSVETDLESGSQVDISECVAQKTAASADVLEASISIDMGKCLSAIAKAQTENTENTEASSDIPEFDFKVDLYAKITCAGQGEAMKSGLDSVLAKASDSSSGSINVDFDKICAEQTFEVYQQTQAKGQFLVTVDSVDVKRSAPNVGCKYTQVNGVTKLQGTCEYVTLELQSSGLEGDAPSGKIYRRVLATDIQETSDGWPSSGTLDIEVNNFSAKVTFSGDKDPTYVVTSPAESVTEGTIAAPR